tara:strand:- start:154 stop:459 length:306 start_codon:yes stop_codon:yes gene_type:complete
MAKFIKIKKQNFASSTNVTADVVIGADTVAAVVKGTVASVGDSNSASIYFAGGGSTSMQLDLTAKGVDIATAVNNALTANPGGVLSIVQLGDLEITGLALA